MSQHEKTGEPASAMPSRDRPSGRAADGVSPVPAPALARHTPEPWVRRDERGYFFGGANGHGIGQARDLVDLSRILACVNACAGIPTKALEVVAISDDRLSALATAIRCAQLGKLNEEGR